jgi:hypothetical protein
MSDNSSALDMMQAALKLREKVEIEARTVRAEIAAERDGHRYGLQRERQEIAELKQAALEDRKAAAAERAALAAKTAELSKMAAVLVT